MENFKNRHVCLLGDLNSRCAAPLPTRNYNYKTNPDKVVNSYVRRLIKLCTTNNLFFINALSYPTRQFDSDLTFFRGALKSQNDWCISNNVESIELFRILPKLNVSDHAPYAIIVKTKTEVSWDRVRVRFRCRVRVRDMVRVRGRVRDSVRVRDRVRVRVKCFRPRTMCYNS